MRLLFSNVGRKKRTWILDVNEDSGLFEDQIDKSIRKNGGLLSRDVDFDIDLDDGRGTIFAGFHKVGDITVLIEQEAEC